MKNRRIRLLISLLLVYHSPLFAQNWSLDSCLSYAAINNKTLLAESQNIKASEQEKKSIQSQLLPTIDAHAGIDHYWKIPVQVFPGELLGKPAGTFAPVRLGTPWMGDYGVEANLNLIDVGQWRQIKLSVLQEKAANYSYAAIQRELFKNVRMAFYNVQVQQESIEIADSLYENYQNVHLLISQQFVKGLIDKITFNQSMVILNNRKDHLAKSQAQLKSDFLNLKFWMGFPLKDTLAIRPDQKRTTVNSNFNEELLPDYNLQKANVALAKQNWQTSKAAWLPSLQLSSTYQRLSYGQQLNFISNGKWFDVGFVGLKLKVPLLALGKTVYVPEKQKILWKKTELEFEQYKQEKQKSFLNEHLYLQEASSALQQQSTNLNLSKENEQLSVQKIEKGIIDMIQLKQVQEDLYQAQDKLNDLKLEYFRHLVELIYLQSDKQ